MVPKMRPYVGCSEVGVKLHQRAVAAALKRQKKHQALREHVSVAKQMSTADKARIFIATMQAPSPIASVAPTNTAAPATAVDITIASAPDTTTPAADNAAVQQTKQNDADAGMWTHGTVLTFLDKVVAHNPFVKCPGTRQTISDKWHAVAAEMAEATRNLNKNTVVTTADALRVKFARIKVKCKNYRENCKSQRQSGLIAARDNLAELADHMDACLNLQKDAEHNKEQKKKAKISKENYKVGVVQLAVMKMAAGASYHVIVQVVDNIIQGTNGGTKRTAGNATFVTLLCKPYSFMLFEPRYHPCRQHQSQQQTAWPTKPAVFRNSKSL